MALRILQNAGLLPEDTKTSYEFGRLLDVACSKFIEASVAKGNARNDQEIQDVVLILIFQQRLQEDLLKVN